MASSMLQMIQRLNPDKEYPANTGVKWSDEEDKILLEEIGNNIDFETIAENHKRTIGGIHARRREIAYKMYLSSNSIEEIVSKTKLSRDDINLTITKKQNATDKKQLKENSNNIAITVSDKSDVSQLKSDIVSMKSDIVSMRNEIFELKKTINGLADMLKLVYEFESEQ